MNNSKSSAKAEKSKNLEDISLIMLTSRLVKRLHAIKDDNPEYYKSQVTGLLIILRNVNRVYKGEDVDTTDEKYRSDMEFTEACLAMYGEDDSELVKEPNPFYSKSTGKEFDPAEVLQIIQTELLGNNNPDKNVLGDDLSLELPKRIGTLGMVLDGLCYQWQNSMLGEYLDEDYLFAISSAFDSLKEVIDIREDEHKFIWNMALHGEENPHHSKK